MILLRRRFPIVCERLHMTNKGLLFFAVAVAVVILAGRCVYLRANLNKTGMDGTSFLNVDGSSLRICNKEFIVTNLLSLCVRPTKKTSEWIYVCGDDCEILINEQRLEITGTSTRYFCDGREENSGTIIKSELPVLLRFFNNEVVVTGSKPSAKGQIRVEDTRGLYDVKIRVKKACRIVIKANWYEFTSW